MLRFIGRFVKWAAIVLVTLVVLLLSPVGYIETFCRADPEPSTFVPLITTPEQTRAEANTYLTYPEWHIVYAYEGLAKVLESGDEYQFPYMQSVGSFWSSFCSLNREANRHGEAEFEHRATIHIIGLSFTVEMATKALYEETIGRLTAAIRGPEKSPQDRIVAEQADAFGAFLHQQPWYDFDFATANETLWAAPVTGLRSWERRLAIGGEWKAKTSYAKAIGALVAAAGEAKLDIYSIVSGLTEDELLAFKDVTIVSPVESGFLINTPRYTIFSNLVAAILAKGGHIVDIAGNDDIMLSAVTADSAGSPDLENGRILAVIPRDGFADERLLINARVGDLDRLLPELKVRNIQLEQMYDY